MKLKDGVIISKTRDDYVMVAAGEAGKSFNGMVRLNSTAAFILDKLKKDSTIASLIQALTREYDVSPEEAEKSVVKVVELMKEKGLILL